MLNHKLLAYLEFDMTTVVSDDDFPIKFCQNSLRFKFLGENVSLHHTITLHLK